MTPALRHAWLLGRTRAARLMPRLFGKPRGWDRYSFSRKLRWRCRNPDPAVDYALWADKARARDLVEGRMRVPELYAVVRRPEEIAPPALPPTFVMKATHGWDMSLLVRDRVVVGRNRSNEGTGQPATAEYLRQVAGEWLASEAELQRQTRECHYAFVHPGILFEEYLHPIDYELQLFLFHGRYRIAMVFYRGFRHEGSTHRLYDETWHLRDPGDATAAESYERSRPPTPRPPEALFKHIEELCRPIDHVRVDLYAVGGTWVFGEFTFTHAAGRAGNLGKYDAELGPHWER